MRRTRAQVARTPEPGRLSRAGTWTSGGSATRVRAGDSEPNEGGQKMSCRSKAVSSPCFALDQRAQGLPFLELPEATGDADVKVAVLAGQAMS